MYRKPRPHPLQSFRFWVLVAGCIAAIAAWRAGLLPVESQNTAPSPDEVALSRTGSDADAPLFAGDAPLSIADGQHEPGETIPPAIDVAATADPSNPWSQFAASAGRMNSVNPGSTGSLPGTASTTSGASPFGPANPQFVAKAGASEPRSTTPESANPFAAASPGIQQVAAVEPQVIDDVARQAKTVFNAQFTTGVRSGTDWSAIDRMIAQGQDVEAHRELSTMYWERPELRSEVLARIQQTARRIYFQPQPHFMDAYEVQSSDRLQEIAGQFKVSWQYLAKLNRVDPRQIRPGQKLKVIEGPFGAVVDLRRFELTVESYGYFVACFPVGIGKDGTTPIGEFTVQDKLEDPTYYGPDRVIANDDPANPLGEFWIAIGDGYGLHGTIDENSIGRAESRGCVRLRNQDIADLYDLLTVGSRVVIRR